MVVRANLLGQSFGSLKVVGETRAGDRRAWVCSCACGGTVNVLTGSLRGNMVTNCGCERSSRRKLASLKHGHNKAGARTKEYRAWCHIRGRCENPNERHYPDYGGRGISVHPSWQNFDTFLADMGAAPSAKHSIDRIDNNGNYEPGNCRWATSHEQASNTRRTIRVDGVCLKEACAKAGVSYEAAPARIRRGQTVEQALSPLTGHAYRAMIAATSEESSK